MAYRVSNIVIYIAASLPGIAQLSPSDQPAPPVCGAFFFCTTEKLRPADKGWVCVTCFMV
ncbi:hypothetical protein AGR1A_Cc30302 [Agrobacterium fabacearum CFBP 5771]|nr:hypothetical protein AGR1A_Cc30302 [Agrobacterium fabacearum CFBP 5771]